MEKRTPFFLSRLLRSPQNSKIGEQKGWENTSDETRFGGWGSSPGSTSSGAIAKDWADEPPNNHYNGWGSGSDPGSVHRSPTPQTSSNRWAYDSSPNGKSATREASSNGWMTDDLPVSEPIRRRSRPVNFESFPPPSVPSAPLLPDEGFNEQHVANTSDHPCFDYVKKDVVSGNGSEHGDGSCVVCWEAPVEGTCVPCGHMASCMPCLREIESKQGTCPVCRAKIDKVMRIYAIST
ncbi:hypothetical protein L2E82_00282 [Cichorium intybus]|uniref:Uncharacterized protein n=1 Tax=Cichorium intybus TaxID=13427 RepID=A0ACB9GYP5_CICIN|nr:hypothetical protein L2E82_00282 [Cichorium intybus]